LTMDEKVMDIFLFRNISLLLFLKSFKKAERHSNKITDLSWLINCARVFADEGRQVALSLVVASALPSEREMCTTPTKSS
jgi:hypothetical protein